MKHRVVQQVEHLLYTTFSCFLNWRFIPRVRFEDVEDISSDSIQGATHKPKITEAGKQMWFQDHAHTPSPKKRSSLYPAELDICASNHMGLRSISFETAHTYKDHHQCRLVQQVHTHPILDNIILCLTQGETTHQSLSCNLTSKTTSHIHKAQLKKGIIFALNYSHTTTNTTIVDVKIINLHNLKGSYEICQ